MVAMHQRAGVSHGDALGRAAPGDQREYWFTETLFDQDAGEILFFMAADFTNDKQALGALILRIEGHEFGIARAFDRIPAHTDPYRLTDAGLRQAITGFIRKRAGLRHQAKRTGQ